eukprot:910206-Prymnesium_polylepis.1
MQSVLVRGAWAASWQPMAYGLWCAIRRGRGGHTCGEARTTKQGHARSCAPFCLLCAPSTPHMHMCMHMSSFARVPLVSHRSCLVRIHKRAVHAHAHACGMCMHVHVDMRMCMHMCMCMHIHVHAHAPSARLHAGRCAGAGEQGGSSRSAATLWS